MSIFSKDFDLEEARARIGKRVAKRKSMERDVSPLFESYLKVASLMQTFDPASKLVSFEDNPTAAELLLNQSEAVSRTGERWRLKNAARDWGLRLIEDSQEALEIFKETQQQFSKLQSEAFIEYLNGTRKSLQEQTLNELRASQYAVSRLNKIAKPPELPSLDSIASRIQELQTYAGLNNLTESGVFGRDDELDKLRRFVGVLKARSMKSYWLDDAGRSLRGLFSQNRQPPLLIYGPGGIGKSTILAAFIQEHATSAGKVRFPFCYLDFERPSLSPRDPFSIIEEISRQLHFQFSDLEYAFTPLDDQIESEKQYRRREARREQSDETAEDTDLQRKVERARFRRARKLVEILADVVVQLTKNDLNGKPDGDQDKTLKAAERKAKTKDNRKKASTRKKTAKKQITDKEELPFLIILDSFEQAQQRSINAVGQLWDLFKLCQRRYRLLRVIVSGRAPVDNLWEESGEPDKLKIEELKAKFRVQLLVKRGMPKNVSEMISEKLGGNPLTLRLAASLFKKRKAKDPNANWLKELKTGWWRRFFDDTDAFIQGQLYHRILEPVARDDVRQLAHPGLVLRRITPDIIRKVLAVPCGLGNIDEERSKELFDELSSEVDLVERRSEEQVLYHRPDIREVMLKLMQNDKSEKITQIERKAVEFYQPESDPELRAEEIYHRLRLGEHPRIVADRWISGVEKYLDDALPEVPLKAQAFLASKLEGLQDIGEDVFKAADLADWEVLIADRAKFLIEQKQWSEALKVMRERKERSPDSVLYPLEAKAMIEEGRDVEAEKIINSGLEATIEQGNQRVRLDLMELAADLALSNSDPQTACDYLEAASNLAGGLEMHLRQVSVLLKLHDLVVGETIAHLNIADVKQMLIKVMSTIDENIFSGNDELVWQVANAVGEQDHISLRKMLRIHRPPNWEGGREIDFGQSLIALSDNNPVLYNSIRELAYEAGYRLAEDQPNALTDVIREMISDGKLVPFLDELIKRNEWESNLRRTVIDHYFRLSFPELGETKLL